MGKLVLLTLSVFLSLNVVCAPNSIVAIVNDNLITQDAINSKNNTKATKLAALNRQIEIILQLEKAQELGIKPKSMAINNLLNRVAQQNSISLDKLKASPEFDKVISSIKKKLTLNSLKKFIINQAKFSLTQVEINQVLKNNPSKADDTVEQIRIAQIIISSIDNKTGSLLDSQDGLIKNKLLDLSHKIKQGESFSALAKLHSQDESYKTGGESVWLIKKRLPKVFSQVIQTLKLQELSAPFKIGKAWGLIKIIETRVFDNHSSNLKAALIRQKKNVFFNNWIKKLRQAAYIEIFDHKL